VRGISLLVAALPARLSERLAQKFNRQRERRIDAVRNVGRPPSTGGIATARSGTLSNSKSYSRFAAVRSME